MQSRKCNQEAEWPLFLRFLALICRTNSDKSLNGHKSLFHLGSIKAFMAALGSCSTLPMAEKGRFLMQTILKITSTLV
ncbi:hypothetical protein AYI74_06625 [Shewanella algae]|nr:hypothetical protein BS332_16505 [Shewanella algae]PST66376.1 hypothetical protein AYI77_14140 [Shewanella algae]PWF92273.1 hypothetical protein DD549_09530 [Shewanella algae]TVL04559.1 hypothetical protein AYI72_10660 [Shewanella algae]TVL53559.1 hypothetical protein AYJ00_20025 [Shewanella algae]